MEQVAAAPFADALRGYLRASRNHGRFASLILFEKPGKAETLQESHRKFWALLDGLAHRDTIPWPDPIPNEIDHPAWEFCFDGEPIFVVCNTPAHILRQSRRSTGFTVTFQPRWVFEGITDSERTVQTAFAAVRARLSTFDFVHPSPALGRYEDEAVREFSQYFLADENIPLACPMNRVGQEKLPDPITSGARE